MATATPEQPTLRLVPPLADEAVWGAAKPPAPAPQPVWGPLLKKWGPWVGVPALLMVAAYWGSPRGPLFR